MEREILFRGKRVDNGEWVYGVPIQYYDGDWQIISGKIGASVTRTVVYETIGQYTGLTDKNGAKIFEVDIVTGTAYSFERVGVIVWIDEIAGFGIKYRKREEAAAWENTSILKQLCKGRNDQFAAAVIGNIHDNPELLGGNENESSST